MIVDVRQLIRDASGDFGCPQCWTQHGTRISPADASCPQCGVALEWPEQAIKASTYWKEQKVRGSRSSEG